MIPATPAPASVAKAVISSDWPRPRNDFGRLSSIRAIRIFVVKGSVGLSSLSSPLPQQQDEEDAQDQETWYVVTERWHICCWQASSVRGFLLSFQQQDRKDSLHCWLSCWKRRRLWMMPAPTVHYWRCV